MLVNSSLCFIEYLQVVYPVYRCRELVGSTIRLTPDLGPARTRRSAAASTTDLRRVPTESGVAAGEKETG